MRGRPSCGFAAPAWVLCCLVMIGAGASPARAALYEVGPGQPYAAINDVPWEALAAGDEVRIHYRPAPYAEKFVVCVAGTQAQPVVIRGVPGPGGELPVITGENATTRPQTNFWSEVRGVIKVGGANSPACDLATWVVIENLEIRSGRPPFTFTGRNGVDAYPNNAASIFVETAQHLTLRNLVLHDSGNGLFVAAADGDTQDILVEGCHIYDNGNVGSIYEHNSYTAARGITFQWNYYGPLRAGCDGNNLKDRSAGLVVRYNFLESGNRQLDLVDAEDSAVIQADPRYHETWVYGNLLLEPDGAGNSQIVHYGGDSGNEPTYRKGTLYFYHNTVVSTRSGNTTLFRLSTNDETADCRNNLFWVTAAGSSLALLNAEGTIALSHNWLKSGYVASHSGLTGTVQDDGSNLTGADPIFENAGAGDYHLGAGSPCIDGGGPLSAAVTAANEVVMQYLHPRGVEGRPVEPPMDIGAFERCTSGACTAVTPDAGVGADAAVGSDAGPGADGGTTPEGKGDDGCGCGTGRGPGAGGAAGGIAWLLCVMGGLFAARRRRRGA